MANIIHHIFEDNAGDFLSIHQPIYSILKALNHILSCRTPALGAAVYDCACGERTFVFHSCRDRHCPVCQNINNARWAEKQMATALPVKYFHIVFTLPDILNPFILGHQKEAYNALFKAASSALLKLCDNPKHLGAIPGFTAVLHTWGQTMQFHPHLHVIITAGGLTKDETRFIDKSGSGYLLPVKALSRLFKGIFIDTLVRSASLPKEMSDALYKLDFFCYLKDPLNRADNVVKYLARYANRVCISEKRIQYYDKNQGTVTFSYKDNRDGGKSKIMTVSAVEFIRRFMLHVLPPRFMKIRHYGILRNRGKLDRIQRCRNLLHSHVTFSLPMSNNIFCATCPKCGSPLTLVGHFRADELRLVLKC